MGMISVSLRGWYFVIFWILTGRQECVQHQALHAEQLRSNVDTTVVIRFE